MADTTLIEWARHPVTGKGATWNIVTGCQIVSPGCTNCYAMKLAGTRLRDLPSRKGLTVPSKAGPVWNGQVRFNEEWLTQPLTWKTGRGIFVAAHGDLFADGVTDAHLDRIFAVMALCPQHVFMVLTKRPERMRAYLANGRNRAIARKVVDFAIHDVAIQKRMLDTFDGTWPVVSEGDPEDPSDLAMRQWPLPNVWLGVSVEDQPRANERIPILLDTPAAIRFISAEPLLGPINIVDAMWAGENPPTENLFASLDWVIAGGESGPDARPMNADWVRMLLAQCQRSSVPFFFKQWGAWREPLPGEEYDTSLGRAGKPPAFIVSQDGTVHCFKNAAIIGGTTMLRVGKKAAGRTLYRRTFEEFPEIRP